MMPSFPAGPYTLEYDYVFDGLSHTFEVNCDTIGDPATGTAPTAVNMRTQADGPYPLNDAADDLWGFIRALFSTLTLCSTYTLWKRNPDNEDKLFISGGVLSAPNGSNIGSPNTPASEAIFTFRSGNGGVTKINLVEGVWGVNAQIPLASDTTTGVPALRDYVLGSANIIMARDRAFPVAPMNSSYGQNEKVWRRRYRS